MVKLSAKLLLLLVFSVFVVACLPGEKRADNRQKRMTQVGVEEVTALSMSQTLENEAARLQALIQTAFDNGETDADGAYAFIVNGGSYAPSQSETVGVGVCPGNTGMYAYLKKDKINGLGNLSDKAPAEEIRKALLKRYSADSVGFYNGPGDVSGIPTGCDTAVAGNGDIAANSPVVVLDVPIVADNKKTHVYSNYEYVVGGNDGTEDCVAKHGTEFTTGQIIYRREITHLDVAAEEQPVEQGAWSLVSDTCAKPKVEKEAIIDWSLSNQGNTDWLTKLSTSSIDPRKMVFCDKSTGSCEQVAADEAKKRIVECGAPQTGDKPAMDPMIASTTSAVSDVTGCSYVHALADGPDGEKRYSLSGCTVPETNNCTAYEIARGVIALEGDSCATSCGKGWYGNISSNYQYRECTVKEVDQDGNITEKETAKSIYNYYDTSVDCTKDNYRTADLTCKIMNAAATSGQMEVKLEGEIHVKLDDNGNLPSSLSRATTAEEFDQAAINAGLASDTGTINSCNAGTNTCKAMSNVDFLAVVIDRSASMGTPISFSRKPTIGTCKGKIENIFEENKVQNMCENLDFKLAVDKLVTAANYAAQRMSSIQYATCDDGSGGYSAMSMLVNPAQDAQNYNPAVFYTGDNYNLKWGYQPAVAQSDYCGQQIKDAVTSVNDALEDVYAAYKKYASHVPDRTMENLVGTRELEYFDNSGNTATTTCDMSSGIPGSINPTAWKCYFEALRDRAQNISNLEKSWLQQGLRERIKDQCISLNADGSVKSSCIDSIKKSCNYSMTDSLVGTCYPPSAFGLKSPDDNDKVSCQLSCLGYCQFTEAEQPASNRNNLVNMILENTVIRYAPADKTNGYALPVMITEFWGNGHVSHSVLGFKATGELSSAFSATTGWDEYELTALGDIYSTDSWTKLYKSYDGTSRRFNTYLRKYEQYGFPWMLKAGEKNRGPGCLDDNGWAFVKAQKDSDGKLYYTSDAQMMDDSSSGGRWRHCPTTREEFIQFIDDNPPVADGSWTNLYDAVERTMLWANNFTGGAKSAPDSNGFRINQTPGRLIIFSDGKDNEGGAKLIRNLALHGSQEDNLDLSNPASIPTDSIEGFMLHYYPNFTIDLMALDGNAIKNDMVVDKNGNLRSTSYIDKDGEAAGSTWHYAELKNDTDEAEYMSSIDTSGTVGFTPKSMCESLYMDKEAAGLTVDPTVSKLDDFLYDAELSGGSNAAAQCLTKTLYSRYNTENSGELYDKYIPCPYGMLVNAD